MLRGAVVVNHEPNATLPYPRPRPSILVLYSIYGVWLLERTAVSGDFFENMHRNFLLGPQGGLQPTSIRRCFMVEAGRRTVGEV